MIKLEDLSKEDMIRKYLELEKKLEDRDKEIEKLKEIIKKEKAINGDETSAKRNGLPSWLWGFFSLTIALFVFN